MQKETTSFSYIDAAVLDRVKPDPAPRESEAKDAKEKSRQFIAGFPLNDPEAEKKALDTIIEKRNKSVTDFLRDRKDITEKLGTVGVTPLAVVPSKAWANICRETGLVVMSPDKQGRVTVSRTALHRYGSAKEAEEQAAHNHAEYIKALFPHTPEAGISAKVVLPTPPEDVIAILLKVKDISGLKLAAVPEAIRFVESPTELYNQATVDPKDEWARRQGYADFKDWVRRDPIVFYDHGTASAVIAQFGDFPIEKKVVDMVMAGNDLIPETPAQVITASALGGFASITDAAENYYIGQQHSIINQMMAAGNAMHQGVGYANQGTLGGLLNLPRSTRLFD